MNVTIPTVHLNGTSYQELCDQMDLALGALSHAIVLCRNTVPHSRDYYVQRGNTIDIAMQQFRDRIQRLESVESELLAIAEGISDQRPHR